MWNKKFDIDIKDRYKNEMLMLFQKIKFSGSSGW